MFPSRSSLRFVALAVCFLFVTAFAPIDVGAWPGTPVASAPGTCAATPFTHTLPPPWATSPNGGKARDWISGDGIMIGLRMDYLGEWIEGANAVFFWTANNVELRISGQRLDATPAATPMALDGAVIGASAVTGSTLSFPTPGCWAVTVSARQIGSTVIQPKLQFTARVMPEDQHAAKAAAVARRKANLPGPLPATCRVSTWDGPRRTGQGADYAFFIDGNGIALRSADSIYAAGENELQWLTGSEQEMTLTGLRLDAPGTIEDVVPYFMIPGNGYPDFWMTSLTFPHAGCWQLTATSGDNRLTATMYVFPQRKASQP